MRDAGSCGGAGAGAGTWEARLRVKRCSFDPSAASPIVPGITSETFHIIIYFPPCMLFERAGRGEGGSRLLLRFDD